MRFNAVSLDRDFMYDWNWDANRKSEDLPTHVMDVHLSIYLSIYLSINPSIHPSIHPSIYLFFYLSSTIPVVQAKLKNWCPCEIVTRICTWKSPRCFRVILRPARESATGSHALHRIAWLLREASPAPPVIWPILGRSLVGGIPTLLKHMSQLGWWHSQLNGKIQNIPNHQPVLIPWPILRINICQSNHTQSWTTQVLIYIF